MSIEAVKKFYEKVATDESFQNKLNEIQENATKGLEFPLDQNKKIELLKNVIIPFAEEQGFEFSTEDIVEYESSLLEELNENEIEKISGAGLSMGVGGAICKIVGFGLGTVGADDRHGGGGAICLLLGFGNVHGLCVLFGGSEKI